MIAWAANTCMCEVRVLREEENIHMYVYMAEDVHQLGRLMHMCMRYAQYCVL